VLLLVRFLFYPTFINVFSEKCKLEILLYLSFKHFEELKADLKNLNLTVLGKQLS